MDETLIFVGLALPGLVAGLLVALWLAPTGARLLVLIVGGVVPIAVVAWLLFAIFDIRGWSAALLFVEVFANWVAWALGAIAGAAARGGRDGTAAEPET